MIIAVEQALGIRFATAEVARLKQPGQSASSLIRMVEEKLAAEDQTRRLTDLLRRLVEHDHDVQSSDCVPFPLRIDCSSLARLAATRAAADLFDRQSGRPARCCCMLTHGEPRLAGLPGSVHRGSLPGTSVMLRLRSRLAAIGRLLRMVPGRHRHLSWSSSSTPG